jgi:hypothetical protein
LRKRYDSGPGDFWREALRQRGMTNGEARTLGEAARAYFDELNADWLAEIDWETVDDEIAEIREEVLREAQARGINASAVRRTAPYLFPGPSQFRYFRPHYGDNGELEFVPTAETRLMQLGQGLMVGSEDVGHFDDARTSFTRYAPHANGIRRNAFVVPQTPEESLAWFALYGVTNAQVLTIDSRSSGALIQSSADLTAIIPVGALLSRTPGVLSFLAQAGRQIAGSTFMWAAAEQLAERFGPAGAVSAQIAPIVLGVLRRRLTALRAAGNVVGLSRARQIASYADSDLARAALHHRRTTGIGRSGNVVVIEYELNGTRHIRAFDSVGRGGRHSDFIARDALPRGAVVRRLFTERQPCQLRVPNCDRMLAREFPNAEITFLVEYGDAVSRARGNAALDAILRRELGQ